MKRLLFFICTLLCANVLWAQTRFIVGELQYEVTGTNEVEVHDCMPSAVSIVISDTVTYQEITYSVTSIGDEAFKDCSSLTSVTIPNSVTSIVYAAFQNCSSLTSINIPNSVTSIGSSAFYQCRSLTSITIGNSVTSIGYAAFYDCSSLTSVNIPNSVTSIGNNAFKNCSSLTSVTIGNSVTSIGSSAFYNCRSLTSIDIPNSVTSIEREAFYNCRSLTSVTLPENATIHNSAFENAGIKVVIDSVTYSRHSFSSLIIGFNTFNVGLTTFYMGENVYRNPVADLSVSDCDTSKSGEVIIPSSIEINEMEYPVTSIGSNAFQSCSSLTSVTIPNSVTSIGYEAFYDCSSLTSVTIPNSVTSIGQYAFQSCDNLTSVTIGNSVTSIGYEAFYHCSSLTSVTCLANTPPSLGSSVFSNTPSNKVLYVPCGSVEAYSSNSSWRSCFSNRIFELNREVEISLNDSNLGSVEVVSDCVEATLTATANEGYAFLSWNDGNTDNPRIVSLSSDTAFTAYFGNTLIYDTICQGTTYEENNFNQTEEGFYTQTTTDVNGQDSVVVLSLNLLPTFNTELTATICEGSSYTENGFNVTEAGTYTQTLQTINGCDSIVTLTLNVNPSFNTDLTASICEGESYTENNFNVSEAGTYTQTLQTVNGCDSIVTLTLTVNPVYNTELTATICEGQTYTENGFNVSEAGTYTQNLQTINGCDSIVTLTLSVNPNYHLNLSTTICEGYTLNISGFEVSEAGTFTQTFTAINGCDSVVTLTVTANPSYNTELTATICEGESYTENNFNVSEAGVYTQNLQTINGCDSIVTLTLNVNPIYNTDLVATICEGTSYTENGFNVNEAGTYTQTLQTINGCDSIVTLTLNVNPIYNTELTATICEGQSYTENGFNVSEAGTYTQSLQTINGCDSIVTLTLNVNPIFNTELSATICEGTSYTENGFNVTEAGTYTQTLQTVNGCDSIVTLTLNVNPVFNTDLTATICEGTSYTENGFNVTEAGTYTQNLQTINGCDSIVTLTLTVNPIFNTELTATICEGQSYTENGFNVSEAGTYTQNLQTINGCDSIVTLTLSVNPIFNTELTATICEGQSYTENGFNVTEAGTYTQSLQTINGCDSIVTLTLNVNPTYHLNLSTTICEGYTLNISGFEVSEAGTFTQTFTAINGCDSVVTLTVTANPSYNTELTATICEGTSYTENGFNVTEAGTYTQSLQTINGCDSIVTLTLNVNPIYNTDLTATICEGSSYTENNFNVSEGGIYTQTHTAVNGCDSIVTLTVTELPIIHTNLTLSICEGTTLNFSGFNVSEAGVYTQSLQTINGCDSVVTLTVTTYPTFDTTITATINAGETYAEFGFNESEAGTFVQNLQTEFGCDSTITLILDVNSSLIDVKEEVLSFYPNPTQGKITFSSMIERIEVIDLSGRVVMNFENTSSINIDALPSGAYYLRLHQNDKAIMRKVIKE